LTTVIYANNIEELVELKIEQMVLGSHKNAIIKLNKKCIVK
jgi:hypothetical protein